jgi:hypothetical protein
VNIPFDQLISSVPNPFVSNVQVSNPFVSNPFVSNPFVSNPFVSNATFAEAPPSGGTGDFHDGTRHDYRADQVLVTLRAYQLKPTAQLTAKFDPVDNPPSFAVHSHARNVVNGKKQQGPPPFAIKGSDLVASDVFPAASVTAGFTIPVPQATVTNSGNLKSGTFRYGYYLSTDAVIDPKQDVLLAAGTVQPKLDPGQTNTAGPADVTIPSTVAAGSYFYGIAFDDTGHVGETDETNNFVSAPLIVASLGTVDQQQPLIDAAAAPLSIGGATAQKVSQEVTGGVTGSLSNVLLPVSCASGATVTLQIQGVNNKGVPNGVVLSTTTFAGGSTSGAGGGFFDYPLAAPVPMTAGQKFSIVLTGTATGSCTIAQGPVSDPYKPGAAFSDSLSVTPGVWDALPAKRDFPFKTLVK